MKNLKSIKLFVLAVTLAGLVSAANAADPIVVKDVDTGKYVVKNTESVDLAQDEVAGGSDTGLSNEIYDCNGRFCECLNPPAGCQSHCESVTSTQCSLVVARLTHSPDIYITKDDKGNITATDDKGDEIKPTEVKASVVTEEQLKELLEKGLINESEYKSLVADLDKLAPDAGDIAYAALGGVIGEAAGGVPQARPKPCYIPNPAYGGAGSTGSSTFVSIGNRSWLGCVLAGGTRLERVSGSSDPKDATSEYFTLNDKGMIDINEDALAKAESKMGEAFVSSGGITDPSARKRGCWVATTGSNGGVVMVNTGQRSWLGCFLMGGARAW